MGEIKYLKKIVLMAKYVANIFIEHLMVIKIIDLFSGTTFSSALTRIGVLCIGVLI